ncbi:MAG: AAA family ATPase, partial [Candidatus Bathyarchaeota archaeon]
MSKQLVLITGMSGSGKTTLADHFEDKGLRVVTMGDVIRDLAEERGLSPTPENLGQLARGIRAEGGDAAVAERCVQKIESIPANRVVVDGIRSIGEVEVFGKYYDTSLVAVYASPKTRYLRLQERGRSDDPHDPETFRDRDHRELGFSLGHAVALADFTINNEGTCEGL